MSASHTETETGSPDQHPECEFDADDLDISDFHKRQYDLEEWECSRSVWEEASENRCVWHASDDQTQEKPRAELEKAVGDGDLHGSAAAGVNLGGIDFPVEMGFIDADLSGTSLEDADLSGANLYDADLSGAYLRDADLSGANLRDADLSEANLGNADLSEANLGNADLSGANLGNADLSGASLRRADLLEASLRHADLSGASLPRADLSGANLYDADLSEASLRRADLSEASLPRADLSGTSLEDADLSGAYLRDADLSGANLYDADLSGASLKNADLSGAYLRDADLPGTTLENADLSGASLKNADLPGATLENADLSGADLENADLSGADLRGADLSATHLAETEFQDSTLSRDTDIDSPSKRICQPNSGLASIRRLVELVRNNHANGERTYDQIARANHELREAYSANGLISRAREARFRERRARRREAVAEEGIRGTVAYLGSVLSMIVTGYGVRLRWVGGSMLLLYLVSAVIYWQFGDLSMGRSLYYSIVTFTTSPPAEPDLTGPILGIVEGFETFAGTAAIVFLGYVLGTRERV